MTTTTAARFSANNRFHRDNDGIKVDAALRRAFPAVFSTKAHPKMSDEYQLFRSDKIIEEMDRLNFSLVEIRQLHSSKRKPEYNAHTMRFRPTGKQKALAKVGDTVAEAHIVNSHNGLTRLIASSGLFRLACLNGLVVPDALYGSARVRHYGEANTFEAVQEIVHNLMERLPDLASKIAAWKAIKLAAGQQKALAKLLLQVREMPEWIEPKHVLEAHREVDAVSRSGSRDLWTTFNVIQENVMNRKITMEGTDDVRGSSTRPVTGAITTFNLNRLLWLAAERSATALKAGKGIPAKWDAADVPELLGEEKPSAKETSEAVATRAIAKAQRAAKRSKVRQKAKSQPTPRATKAGKAQTPKAKADEAFRAKRAEAARLYRLRKKEAAAAGTEAQPEPTATT